MRTDDVDAAGEDRAEGVFDGVFDGLDLDTLLCLPLVTGAEAGAFLLRPPPRVCAMLWKLQMEEEKERRTV